MKNMESVVPDFKCVDLSTEAGAFLGTFNDHLEEIELVIFSGPLDITEPFREIVHGCSDAKVGILYCSSLGQYDLQGEWGYVWDRFKLLEDGTYDFFFTGSNEVKVGLSTTKIADRIRWLPQTMNVGLYPFRNHTKRVLNTVGMFADQRARKNWSVQLAALNLMNAGRMRGPRSVHTSKLSDQNRRLAEYLGIGITEHAFMPYEHLIELMASMEVGCQVTFGEAFNYVAAEFILQGVPCACSHSIFWAPDAYKVDNPESVMDVATTLDRIRSTPYSEREIYRNQLIDLLGANARQCREELHKVRELIA